MKIFAPGARKEQFDLESARQQVSDLIPKLKACSVSVEQSQQSSTECRQTYDQVSAVLSGNNVLAPLTWFESRNGGNGGSSSSSGGGGESSNDSNNSNNGGCGGLNFLGGALPIPSGGLGGLGLPLAPIDQAVTAMRPFAIAAQNALAFASDLACSLGDSSSASEISDAGNALDTARSGMYISLNVVISCGIQDSVCMNEHLRTFGRSFGSFYSTRCDRNAVSHDWSSCHIADRLDQPSNCF